MVFVHVEASAELQKLYTELKKYLSDINKIRMPKMHEQFTPHITLANRDLSPENFQKAWPVFENRLFNDEFSCEKIVLYKHDGKLWQEEMFFEP